MITSDQAREKIKSVRATWKKSLADYSAQLETDPLFAFEWCEKHIAAAAELQTWQLVEDYVEAGESVEAARDCLLREVLKMARSPQRSTSMVSNLVFDFRRESMARAVEKLGRPQL